MAKENMPNAPKKKIEPVVSAENVTVKKKSALSKIRDAFISEDADKVGSYILMDVLVPNIKRSIVDIIKSSADMIFGTKGSSSNGSQAKYSYGGIPYVSYSSATKRTEIPAARSQYEIGDIVFRNREEALKVLENLEDIISAYGSASVADLCDLTSQPYEFVANKYGWKDLHDAAPIMTSGGWSLRLPKSKPLE